MFGSSAVLGLERVGVLAVVGPGLGGAGGDDGPDLLHDVGVSGEALAVDQIAEGSYGLLALSEMTPSTVTSLRSSFSTLILWESSTVPS